jgi:RimJ/RimL family protein N-acetyltransferase
MTPFEPINILTPRLGLRLLQEGDVAALFAIYSHPEVMRYWGELAWTDASEAERVIANAQDAFANQRALQLGVERLADNALIGTCSVFHFHFGSRRAEIGYALGYAYWKQGYMNEALQALVRYCFTTLELNRLEADIDPRNLASARTLERLGFRQEGFLRERWIVGAEVSDTALYGLLRREWQEI